MYRIMVFGNMLTILAVSSDSTSTHPCTSSSPTCPLQTSVSLPPPSQTCCEHLDTEQSNHLWRLHHPDIFSHTLCRIIWPTPGCDGLWQVCGHLPPLHYLVIMNIQLSGLLVLLSWTLSDMHLLLHSLVMLWLSFCPDLWFPSFFCELNQVVQFASSDTFLITWWCIFHLFLWVGVILLESFILILKLFPVYMESHRLRKV